MDQHTRHISAVLDYGQIVPTTSRCTILFIITRPHASMVREIRRPQILTVALQRCSSTFEIKSGAPSSNLVSEAGIAVLVLVRHSGGVSLSSIHWRPRHASRFGSRYLDGHQNEMASALESVYGSNGSDGV